MTCALTDLCDKRAGALDVQLATKSQQQFPVAGVLPPQRRGGVCLWSTDNLWQH